MIDKPALRRELRARLRALDAASRTRGSADVVRQLGAVVDEPGPVMLYAPMAVEVDVWPIVVARLAAGRVVGLPRIEPDDQTLSVRQLTSGPMIAGQLGILEPDPEAPRIDADVVLVVVPGLGFDGRGGRLGRGKGHYDRLLARLGARTVGVAFDVQRVDRLPLEAHDVAIEATVFGQTA